MYIIIFILRIYKTILKNFTPMGKDDLGNAYL